MMIDDSWWSLMFWPENETWFLVFASQAGWRHFLAWRLVGGDSDLTKMEIASQDSLAGRALLAGRELHRNVETSVILWGKYRCPDSLHVCRSVHHHNYECDENKSNSGHRWGWDAIIQQSTPGEKAFLEPRTFHYPRRSCQKSPTHINHPWRHRSRALGEHHALAELLPDERGSSLIYREFWGTGKMDPEG